jgi:hypothetical protein
MNELHRFSSRRQRLDHAFLSAKLQGAKSYRRIAGYFRSSIFELVGEQIAGIPTVQVVCNSELDVADVAVSRHVRETALKERWNEASPEVESLLHRERYRRLHELLTSGRVEIRVVPKDRIFLHGKAGVIEAADGSKTCFLGSINETKSAFADNYEILWEDTSPEGVAWVEEEFAALWDQAYPLPEAIVHEIQRIADRVEIRFQDAREDELPAAALAESPIYRGGEQLQPWQRSFVTIFLEHRETYGKARLLLADEVGVGKTLSLGASAMLAVLLGDGPVLILCPSTLTLQWQVELKDRLGIPSAVWSSTKKVWLDPRGHVIKTRGAEDIARCPFRIAIVSTGLIFHDSDERRHLLERRFGTVILDEAHKARRRGGLGEKKNAPNNLLEFMLAIAPRTKNLLLGTATPIQTEVHELWDLLRILNQGADFVLGREWVGSWFDWEAALPLIKGDQTPDDERDAWQWLRNPLPPGSEDTLFASLRLQLGLPERSFFTDRGFGSLGFFEQQAVAQTLDPEFFATAQPAGPPHRPAAAADVGRGRIAGQGGCRNPSRSGRSGNGLSGRPLPGLGAADQSSVRPGVPGGRVIQHRAAATEPSGRVHEEPVAAAAVFQFRVGPGHRPADAAARMSGRRRRESGGHRGPVEHLDRRGNRSSADDPGGTLPPRSPRSQAGRRAVFPDRASHRGQDLAGTRLHHFQPVLRHRVLGRRRVGGVDRRRARGRLRRGGQERPVPRSRISRRSSARRSRRRSRSVASGWSSPPTRRARD